MPHTYLVLLSNVGGVIHVDFDQSDLGVGFDELTQHRTQHLARPAPAVAMALSHSAHGRQPCTRHLLGIKVNEDRVIGLGDKLVKVLGGRLDGLARPTRLASMERSTTDPSCFLQ